MSENLPQDFRQHISKESPLVNTSTRIFLKILSKISRRIFDKALGNTSARIETLDSSTKRFLSTRLYAIQQQESSTRLGNTPARIFLQSTHQEESFTRLKQYISRNLPRECSKHILHINKLNASRTILVCTSTQTRIITKDFRKIQLYSDYS